MSRERTLRIFVSVALILVVAASAAFLILWGLA